MARNRIKILTNKETRKKYETGSPVCLCPNALKFVFKTITKNILLGNVKLFLPLIIKLYKLVLTVHVPLVLNEFMH